MHALLVHSLSKIGFLFYFWFLIDILNFVGVGFAIGGGGENEAGVHAAELPQQMQRVPPLHGGAGPHAAESQPSRTRRQAARLLRIVAVLRRKQVLQLQAARVEMQMRRPFLQPLMIKNSIFFFKNISKEEIIHSKMEFLSFLAFY